MKPRPQTSRLPCGKILRASALPLLAEVDLPDLGERGGQVGCSDPGSGRGLPEPTLQPGHLLSGRPTGPTLFPILAAAPGIGLADWPHYAKTVPNT